MSPISMFKQIIKPHQEKSRQDDVYPLSQISDVKWHFSLSSLSLVVAGRLRDH